MLQTTLDCVLFVPIKNPGSLEQSSLPVKASVSVFCDNKVRNSLDLGWVQGKSGSLDHPSNRIRNCIHV